MTNSNDLRRRALTGSNAARRAAAAIQFADQIAKEGAADAGLWEPTEEGLKSAAQKVQAGIKAPFVKCQIASLGGLARSSVMIALSLDPKEDWANGIFENGRSGRLSISRDGVIEHFSGGFHRVGETKYNFRKARVKTLDAAIAKINAFVAAAPNVGKASRPAMRKAGLGSRNLSRPSRNKEYFRPDGGVKISYHPDLGWGWYVKRHGDWERDDDMTDQDVAQSIADQGFTDVEPTPPSRKASRPAMRKGSDEEDKIDELIERGITNPDAIAREFLRLAGDDDDALGRIVASLGDSMRSDAEAVWRSLRAMSRKASRPAMRKAVYRNDDEGRFIGAETDYIASLPYEVVYDIEDLYRNKTFIDQRTRTAIFTAKDKAGLMAALASAKASLDAAEDDYRGNEEFESTRSAVASLVSRIGKASRPEMRKAGRFTAQELKEAFGRDSHFGVSTDDETWQKVADLMNGVSGDRSADAALEEINRLLDYHGVEGITPEGEVYPKASYVNTGDTYSTTILYDIDQGEIQLTTWGDWLEEWEREHAEEEPEEEEPEDDENDD